VANSGTKPVDSGGANPVSLAVDGSYADLYAANAGNDTVVHFTIAATGVLTQSDSVTLATTPVAIAVSPNGADLFVVSGSTTATLTEYSLSSGKLGSVVTQEPLTIPGYGSDTVIPTAVAVMANGAGVYATAYDQSAYNPGGTTTSTANPGWIFGFAIGSGGALTPADSSPYNAGVKPSGIALDPANRFVYVTDYASNSLIGYGVTSGTSLNFLVSGPYKTGNEPSSVTIDPRGKYIYVSNSLDNTVSAFAIDLTTGIPSAAINATGSASNATDSQPDAIVVEPSEGRYVYTANYLGNSVSGFRLNPNTGTITQTESTPYPSEKNPTAIVAIPHGNHPSQVTVQ
jgi:6-phosphogluconolactonase (cycloisomerase 2 family)